MAYLRCFVHCGEVLFVSYFLQPFDVLAVQRLLDRDVGHGGGGRCPVPMFLSRRASNDVARPDYLFGLAPALRPTETGGDDQGLPARVGMPRGAGTGLESHAGAAEDCGTGCFK